MIFKFMIEIARIKFNGLAYFESFLNIAMILEFIIFSIFLLISEWMNTNFSH